jgi:hypothetical protein
VSLVEVMVAFTVLMIVLIPMAYLFTTSVIQAGQSRNQVQAISIAEKWVEIASNVTPPVNCNGEAVVDQSVPPVSPTSGATTVASGSSGQALPQSTINVASTTGFAAAPQTLLVASTKGLQTVTYAGMTATSFTGVAGGTGTISTGCPVTQPTTTETKGNTTYSLNAEYEWTTVQNAGVGATTIAAASNGQILPQSTINVVSTSTFALASVGNPQTAVVATSTGAQTITYTGLTSTSLTGVTGGTGKMTQGGAVSQNTQPDLCTSGTPQLLKMRMQVGWGPNSDTNNVGDSVILNYPPNGIQTLGFVALQFTGDTTAIDNQGNPWSERVQAPPVTLTPSIAGQLQTLTIYPDSYGCAFAQVLPTGAGTGTYTVSVANASSGTPAGSTYGTPSFVSNGTGTVTNHVLQQPQAQSQSGVTVNIGAVTKLAATYPLSYPGYDQGSTVNLSYPTSSAVEDGVACPGVGQITCISTGQNSSGAVLTWSNQANWSNVTVPAAATRISSVACAGTVECEGVGYNTVGGVSSAVILDANPSTPSIATASTGTALTGVTSLSQIACPSATNCVAIGTTATGATLLTDTISALGVDSWSAATIPANITGLTSLVCPSGGTGCVAIGTTSTGGNGTPIVISGGFGSVGVPAVWSAPSSTSGFTLASLSSVVCPSNTSCVAVGTGKAPGPTGPIVIAGTAAAGLGGTAMAWTLDSFPPGTTVATIGGLNCASSADCFVFGMGTKGAGTVPLLMYAAPTASATFGNDTLPTVSGNPVTALSQMACPSPTQCVLTGTTAGGPVILTAPITSPTTADTWSSAAVPSVGSGASLGQFTQLICWSVNSCGISAVGTNAASQPSAFLLASSGGTTTWSSVGLPNANPALYLSKVDCTTSGSPTYCSAVGASATGAVELASSNGPSGTWTDQTPSGIGGVVAQGVPVEINNTNLLPNPYANVVTAGAASNITQLPDLYPFNGGYGLFAGDCSAELGPGSFNVSQAPTVPGGSANVSVPMGLVSVQALHTSGTSVGLPYAGATLKVTSTAASPCGADVYTLQTAGPDGLSRTAVPFGSYTLSVTGTSTVNVPVVVGGSSVVASGVTYLFPASIPVSVN